VAITQLAAYAQLSDAGVEALGGELDTIRAATFRTASANDATFIRRTIAYQRCLDVAARMVIWRTRTSRRPRNAWRAPTQCRTRRGPSMSAASGRSPRQRGCRPGRGNP
jgi:hypothetical protein